jgi:hypothetical protein
MKKWMIGAAIAGVALYALSESAPAAEIKVLGGMGVVSSLRDLAPSFEKRPGTRSWSYSSRRRC